MDDYIKNVKFSSASPLIDRVLYYRSSYKAKARRRAKVEVPIYEKYTLSVEEASVYYGIGQKRLRSLIAMNPNADYLLAVGNRTQFKRKKFEEFIDNCTCI